jgi:hypothetical protein
MVTMTFLALGSIAPRLSRPQRVALTVSVALIVFVADWPAQMLALLLVAGWSSARLARLRASGPAPS